MYDKVSPNLNFAERELSVLKFWEEEKIFEKSIAIREGSPVFTFYEGPPTANGKPHIGHVLTRAIKDLIPRYKTMKGFKAVRKGGWDTHGLPVELEVEKMLGISGKPQIEEYGIEPFIKQCKESVWKYEKEWRDISDRVGYFCDMDDPYVTYHNTYIESVWWALKQIWDKGLLYKGHKVVPYCPRCGTALSSHEVAQGYADVKDISAFAKFKAKNEENTYFLAWTTTPWTLPSNVCLVVNPKEEYAKVKSGNEYYILAKELCEKVLTEEFEIIKTYVGKDLYGMEYEPLFPYVETTEKAWYVVYDDYVTLTDGSGIVHCAPAFGEDDARIGRIFKLPFVQLVNEQGKFVAAVTDFKDMSVKDADPLIIKKLKEENKLYKDEIYEHSYPFCWRCDTALIYYARDTWFIEMTKLRDNLVKNNNTVNWLPENIKEGRFGNFLENVIDWGLSRERYWGTPLPIWECECGYRDAIGSISELKERGLNIPDDIELHKPYIDDCFIKCDKCGGTMKRVTEVIDCWFDSGAMPFAQWHYPFENKDIFDKNFPADFISEAVDQTRGWFYSLIAISTLLFDVSPFKNVIVLGHVQDKDGQKMSKHKGNVVDPWDVLNKQGADAVRWYFYTNSSPWLPSRFYEEALNEAQRKFMGTLWNTYAFYILYADIDKFNPTEYKLEHDKLPLMDKWILSRLNKLNKEVDEALSEYKITEPGRKLQEFLDDLSNWYVRRSRERFWAKGMEQDKINAYMTLYTVLTSVIKMSAPFVPFVTEEIYQNLVRKIDKNAPISVHLCDWPVYEKSLVDSELDENMGAVLDIVVLGRAARNAANIKNRQPISKILVKSPIKLPESYSDIVVEELNIKSIEFKDDVEEYATYLFKPQLKTLGPKYGKLLSKISEYLKNADGTKLYHSLQKGTVTIDLDGNSIELSMDDVLIETAQKEGFMSTSEKDVTVVMDTHLTDELLEEGFVRELISKIQTMRKEAGFEVLDRINVYYNHNDKLKDIITRNAHVIMEDILCDNIVEGTGAYTKEWNINGENISLSVTKL